MNLPQQLRARRLELGLTQQQAADKAGIARQLWARVETSKVAPTLTTVEKMAAALGLRLELIEGA